MPAAVDLGPVHEFLDCPTPDSWVEWALENPELLLIDHANCEKKAAATAVNLIYRYIEYPALLTKLSRLAREELRHFEQVLAIMRRRGVEYRPISASRYASGLRALVRGNEPGRLVDTLVVGAIIEARSCERFERLAPGLDAELAGFYLSLLKSEARHFKDYLELAETISNPLEVKKRERVFLEKDAELVCSADECFRFHSGPPARDRAAASR